MVFDLLEIGRTNILVVSIVDTVLYSDSSLYTTPPPTLPPMSDTTEFNVNPKLQRTLSRFQEKISTGDFYEAHQTLRTIVNRNVRSKDFKNAVSLLYHSSKILLKSSQPATGADLLSYLIEVYNDSETVVSNESKSKLIELLSLFEPTEPTLKNVAIEAINWSIKFGEHKLGDPDLHHIIGFKFAQNSELAYEAEKHLLLGNTESYPLYLELIWSWYLEDPEVNNVQLYIRRIVLNYLCVQNFKNARDSLSTLISRFIERTPSATHTELTQNNQQLYIFDNQPVLNFLQLLLLTIEAKDTQNFQRLVGRYVKDLNEVENVLQMVGELYFGIVAPKQTNVLQSLMSGLFK
ncbi:hypothetical protein WICPIJ_001067 [Wickerhamomyces pijperi]|uniref:Golgi to ER traffic protein 4 n=1 Tax=Wickerhamomyces pijperi TaxID=599730 RepID=A0A9P8QCB2_WICPI|nr:hypothetical protein WICPIJ_001067 [Wickerhamomyces pijperi]